MAVLTIRNVPDAVRDRLRLRAAIAGTSMEEQVRLVLLQASLEPLTAPNKLALPTWVAGLYGQQKPKNVVEDLLSERRAAERLENVKS